MVRTRKQADAEAQVADPTVPAPIVNPAPSTPASAPPEGGRVKEPGSKTMTPKKANPRKPSPESKSEKDKGKNRRAKSGKVNGSTNDDTAQERQFVKTAKMLATKKGRMKKSPETIIEAPSNGREKEDVDTAEIAKKKGETKSKATRTKRAIVRDTAENDDALGAGEPPTKKITARKLKESPPRIVPTNSETDPDKTETEDDLEQKLKAYEKRKHKQAATKRKAPMIDAEEGQQSAEPSKKKTKRSTARNAAAKDDDPNDKPLEGMASGASSRRAAAATKKAAKAPKAQADKAIGTRRSGRISGNLAVSSGGDEGNLGRRPLQTRFKKRVKTPEISSNKIGLDENEIFNPRFPIDAPKPAKATRRTRNGDTSSTKGKKE